MTRAPALDRRDLELVRAALYVYRCDQLVTRCDDPRPDADVRRAAAKHADRLLDAIDAVQSWSWEGP